MHNSVFVNSLGIFLPNEPVSNDEMETLLGSIHGKPSKLRRRILKQNGIHTRYYALNEQGEPTAWRRNFAFDLAG